MTTGLDGVVVAQTILSHVDGEKGELIIKGLPIQTLVQEYSFEKTAALLWQGLSPLDESEEKIREGLAQARVQAYKDLEPLFQLGASLPLIEGLRLGLAGLSDSSSIPHHYLVTGAIAVLVPALLRLKQNQSPIAPDPDRDHVADFLAMYQGQSVQPAYHKGLTAYLVTVAEHSMNASTFTARVIASTQAGTISSVIGALGALKGPLHGGAPGPVLDMLDEIGQSDNIEPWLRVELEAGQRLMGFGHRIYHVRDPRADVLKEAVRLLQQASHNPRLDFAQAVESKALELLKEYKPNRLLQTNVEFYTALLLEALNFPREAFTPLFATGRVLGWTAHVMEQTKNGRLMRPKAEYVGPKLELLSV